MDVNFIRIFVFILIYKNISVTTGLKIRTARFRIHRKSHDLTRCATKVLNQDSSVGGRVSDQSGACEIVYALNQNQTKEPGYGYFEKVTVKTDFKPAVTIEGLGVPFNLPAPVRNGFRVEAKFTRKETYVAP
ncbi:uncharacterized protein LOC132753470 [Ruditapes philippinarum]|uniref:uncharacterized protein LOC132753470 n=1 Tax=Ruditapes philippinarum TaxID=129788 RepID=UPI00295BBB43|nr:uncharacterized protein LOC132753470 [Ruditapes philippinarum]